MKKNLFYIISLVILILTFAFSYFVGVKFETKNVNKNYIVKEITEEDLLETIKLNLDFGRHHYFGWQYRKYNGMKILCKNDVKILYSIDLEKASDDTVFDDSNNYFTDYRLLYMSIVKKNGYYFRESFFGDDMEEQFNVGEEGLCE